MHVISTIAKDNGSRRWEMHPFILSYIDCEISHAFIYMRSVWKSLCAG